MDDYTQRLERAVKRLLLIDTRRRAVGERAPPGVEGLLQAVQEAEPLMREYNRIISTLESIIAQGPKDA